MYNDVMYPDFLPQIFKGHVSTYGLLLALGLLGALGLFKLLCHLRKVDNNSYSFYSLLGIVAIASGLLGAYVFQAIYNAIYKAVNYGKSDYIEPTGKLTFMGGLVFGVVVFVAGTAIVAKGKVKRDFFECASCAAPCIVAGHILGRLGCFCAGCCYGKETDSVWGIDFPGLGKVYPTQLFEAAFLALLLGVMLVVLLKFKKYKPMLPMYGIGYSIWRFAIEYLRDDDRGTFIPGLTPSQTQSIILFIVAVALVVLLYRNIIPFAKAKDPIPSAVDGGNAHPDETTEDALPDEPSADTLTNEADTICNETAAPDSSQEEKE